MNNNKKINKTLSKSTVKVPCQTCLPSKHHSVAFPAQLHAPWDTTLLGSALFTSSLEWHLSALHPSHLPALTSRQVWTLRFYPHFSDKDAEAVRFTNMRKTQVGQAWNWPTPDNQFTPLTIKSLSEPHSSGKVPACWDPCLSVICGFGPQIPRGWSDKPPAGCRAALQSWVCRQCWPDAASSCPRPPSSPAQQLHLAATTATQLIVQGCD